MKIKREEGNENEENKNEINIKKDATSGDDDETIKDDHHFENLYRN